MVWTVKQTASAKMTQPAIMWLVTAPAPMAGLVLRVPCRAKTDSLVHSVNKNVCAKMEECVIMWMGSAPAYQATLESFAKICVRDQVVQIKL